MAKAAVDVFKVLKSKGADTSFEEHKSEPVKVSGGVDLPAGIDDGIAQLTTFEFRVHDDKHKDFPGEPYLYAAGVVVHPKEVEGFPIVGLNTRISEPMCETPGRARESFDEHFDWVLNELKKFIDIKGLKFANLPAVMAKLVEQGPFFRFRTWAGEKATTGKYAGKEPMTQNFWNGIIPNFDPSTLESMTDAEGTTDETSSEEPVKTEPKATKGKGRKKASPKPEPEEPAEEDLETLATLADDESTDDLTANKAGVTITEAATKAGIDSQVIEDAPNWTALVALIKEADAGVPGGDEPAAAAVPAAAADDDINLDIENEVGDVVEFKPPKKRKAVDCEITAISDDGKLTLKNLANDAEYPDVDPSKVSYEDDE